MSVLVLHKPLPQQHIKLDRNQARVLSLGFSPAETEQIKDGDDLIFVFSDGARLTLVGYYADGTSPLPEFSLASAVADAGIIPLFSLDSNADVLFDLSSKSATRTSRVYGDHELLSDGLGFSVSPSPQDTSLVLDKAPLLKETHRYEMGHMAFDGGVDSLPGFDYAVKTPFPLLSPTKPPDAGIVKPEPPNNPPRIYASPDNAPGEPSSPEGADMVVTLDIKERGVFGDDPAYASHAPNAEHTDSRITDAVSGQIMASDLDNDALSWSLRSEGAQGLTIRTKYGMVSIDAQGRFVYQLDQESINGLNQGQRETDSFYVVVSDGRGGFDEQLVTVNIEGTNDRPELTLTDSGVYHVAARLLGSGPINPLEASGMLKVEDADAEGIGQGQNAGQSNFSITCGALTSTSTGSGGAVIATPKGTLLIRPDGHYTFTVDHSAIMPGMDETLTFTITVKDVHGSSDTVDISVRLTFTANQPPIIGVLPVVSLKEDGLQNGGNAPEPGAISQTGSFVGFASDADGDALRYSITPPVGYASVTIGDVQTITTPYGVLTLNTVTGQYSYVLNRDAALDRMTVGQKITNTFTLTVDDGYDLGVTSKTFTVEIEGTNDAPVLNFAAGSTGLHLGAGGLADSSGPTIRSGKLTVTDVDADGTPGSQVDPSTPHQQFCITNPATGRTSTPNADGRASLLSEYGTLTIDKNGNYTFQINPNAPKVLALGGGKTYVDEFIIFVRDAHGAVSGSQKVRVEIAGKDDPPIFLDSNYVLNLIESGRIDLSNTPTAGISLVSGNVQAKSIDSDKSLHTLRLTLDSTGESGVLSNTITGNIQTIVTKYGTFTLNTSTGAYTFALDNSLAAVQALGYADSVRMAFTIIVTDIDDPRLSRTQDFNVTIKGTNDGPEINGVRPDNILEEDPSTGQYTATGKILTSDVDQPVGRNLTHSLVDTSSGNKLVSVLTGTYGWIEINADGTYTYHLDPLKSQALSAGPQGDTFTVRVKDERGAFTDKVVTIPVTGKDDAPEITTGTLAEVFEDSRVDVNQASTPHPTVTGSVASKDVDVLDTDRRFEANGGMVTGIGTEAGLTYQDIEGTWGVLRLYANGTYRYTLTENSSLAIQALNNGRNDPRETDSFNIKLWSGHDGNWLSSDTGTIIITITGTNDSPVVTAHDDLTIIHSVTMTQVATGTLHIDDVDDSYHTYYFSGRDSGGNPIGLQSHAGTFGVLVVDRTTGKYTFTLNPFSPDFIGLTPGSTGTDTFTIRVEDAHGGWVDQVITVTVHPFSPNVPIDNYLLHGTDLAVTEDVYNALTTNVDATGIATHGAGTGHIFGFVSRGFIATTVVGIYGSIVIDETGKYTYTLNNSMGAVQALGKHSGTLSESFQLWGDLGGSVSDTITITISGTNDSPTITVSEDKNLQLGQVGGVIDPAMTTVSGMITGYDIDRNDSLTYWLKDAHGNLVQSLTVNDAGGQPLYSVTIDNTGKYTFRYLSTTLLNRDQTMNEIFTVVVKDNSGEANDTSISDTFKVTVNGVNTPPIINSVPSLTVREDVTLNASANAVVVDDTGTSGLRYLLVDSGTSPATGTTLMAGSYGTLMITNPSTGQYKYVLNNNQAQINALDENASLTETFYLKVWDKHGGWAIKPVTVTIEGTNDAPSLSLSTSNLNIYEGGSRVSGLCSEYDPDDSSGFIYSLHGTGVTTAGGVDSIRTDYGTLYLNKSTGAYYFEVDNSSPDVRGLREGQNVSLRALGHDFKISVTDNNGSGKSSGLMDVDVTVQGRDSDPVFSTQPVNLSLTGTSASGAAAAFDPDYSSGTTHYGVQYSIFYLDDWGYKHVANAGTTLATKYGTIVIDTNGNYTYTLNSAAGLGQSEKFYVTATSQEPGHTDSTNSSAFNINISSSATPRTRSAFRVAAPDAEDNAGDIASTFALNTEAGANNDEEATPSAAILGVSEPAARIAPEASMESTDSAESVLIPVAAVRHEPTLLFQFEGQPDARFPLVDTLLQGEWPAETQALGRLLQEEDLSDILNALPASMLHAESSLLPPPMSSYNNPDVWTNTWGSSKPYVRAEDTNLPESLTDSVALDLLSVPVLLLDPVIVEDGALAMKTLKLVLENNVG